MLTGTRKNSAFSNVRIASSLIVLCRGRKRDESLYWAYLCMKPSQAEMFYHARQRGRLNLNDHGTILEYGEGEDPPPEVRERMRVNFGMRDDYEDQLIKILETMGKAREAMHSDTLSTPPA